MNQEKIKTVIWSAIGGGILTMIIGFAWGGWVLGSTSLKMSEEMARNAITARLTPTCVALFNQDVEKTAKLQILKETISWDRDQYVMDQGWATMPFEKEPDSDVANSCSTLLIKDS